ncbi:hypothetical protein CV093_20950 [Oceanobacillus sp. 143]|uniref:Uncharacterized protein n=1 Tax=Oceanobacillus zhaokaii TaxID=2052660 RepID=A0A345PLT4_9BACI|nr:hypothetical protein [Oceanobacillus zhaokaii]AXI10964.1 hypothetical protein CUC15_19415 [Oceanobacillus zhaokaii]QGS69795.1 hypothetical protein CV093_20950 [Oceanobacillus sp. 143]
MKKNRKPILETNIINVIIVCVMIAPIMGGLTENLKLFIATMCTIPVVVLLLFILWLKYGYSGIHLNSINMFVMLAMILVYSAIPLFNSIWGTWIGWLTIFVHIITFLIGFINREKLIRNISGIDENGNKALPKFLLYYSIGLFVLGIIGFVSLQVAIGTLGSNVIVFAFLHLIAYYLFAISPVFLNNPERALEMGAISQSHYDEYY